MGMGRGYVAAALIAFAMGCEEPTLSGPGVLSASDDDGSTVSPASLGSPTEVEPGVRRYATTLVRDGEPMKVFVYEPTAAAAAAKRPCVLIGPAGSNLITGMDLGEGDSPEHLPWARKGFVVVAYEIDGYVPDMQAASNEEIRAAVIKFRDAEGGMANARAALDFALEKLPAIDPERIYAVGHSSAATLALQVTADDDRIAACVAFAPPTDLEDHLGEAMGALDQLVPGMRDFVIESSPHNQVEHLTCP